MLKAEGCMPKAKIRNLGRGTEDEDENEHDSGGFDLNSGDFFARAQAALRSDEDITKQLK